MHQKNYTNVFEDNFRMNIFMEKRDRIAKHNEQYAAGNVTFKMGLNEYSDLSTYEINSKLNGLSLE